MTNQEKLIRSSLLDFILSIVGGTELNPIVDVKDLGGALEIEYETGPKQVVSLIVTDSDE